MDVPIEIGEREGAIVRVGYQGFDTRYNSVALRLDTNVGYPVQFFPPINVDTTVRKE